MAVYCPAAQPPVRCPALHPRGAGYRANRDPANWPTNKKQNPGIHEFKKQILAPTKSHPRTCIWYWNPPTKLYCMYMVLIWYSIFVLLKSTSPSISANQKLSNVRSIHGPGTGPSGTGDLKVGSTGNIGEVASSPAPPAFYNRLCCAVAGDCDRDSLWARALELQ